MLTGSLAKQYNYSLVKMKYFGESLESTVKSKRKYTCQEQNDIPFRDGRIVNNKII